MLHPEGRVWNTPLVTQLFDDQLVERILSQAILIHGSQDVRVWRVATRDLYDLHRDLIRWLEGVRI